MQRRYAGLGKSRALYVNNLLFSFLGSKETNSETPMIPTQDNYNTMNNYQVCDIAQINNTYHYL